MSPERLLLISTPRLAGEGYLDSCISPIGDFLGGVKSVLFVPYGHPDYDRYTQAVCQKFKSLGILLRSVHETDDPRSAIGNAEALFVGGGNTFLLLKLLHDNNILSVAREKIKSGTSYVGVSAGAVIACPTIKIWYEMPIVLPPSLDSLSVIPFQITPHYFDVDANREIGKSPKRRIEEFLLINDEIVVALYEGSRLRVENGKTVVEGKGGAIVFKKNEFPKRYEPGDILFGEQIEHP